ncbi:type IV toxin-antitoxin system AbiEi family antitoxin domain-containing protein [Dermacoccus abyssi]
MRTDRRELRRRLQRLVAGQAGYFTAAQALDVGYTYQAQKYHADAGNWLRVERALYRIPEWPTDANDAYIRLALTLGPDAVVSHQSALAAHGLSDASPAAIHVTVPVGVHRHSDLATVHEGDLEPTEIVEHGGWRVTTPARAIADVAADRDVPQEIVTGAVADAVERGLATRRSLRQRVEARGDFAALRIERAINALMETAP